MNSNCIGNTTAPNQPEVLLPVIDGAVGDFCKQDIKVVRVQCTILFAMLITMNLYPVTTKI
jgi:hypothetical protein